MNDQELEVSSGNKRLRLRGSDLLTAIIGIIVCSGLTLLGYITFQHKTDANENAVALVKALSEVASASRDGVQAQREMNCLLLWPQDKREQQADLCRRVTR